MSIPIAGLPTPLTLIGGALAVAGVAIARRGNRAATLREA